MFLLGPHCEKMIDYHNQRPTARELGWGCFQTMFAGAKTFEIPPSMYHHKEVDGTPMWIWHVAYTAGMTNVATMDYLREVIRLAGSWRIGAVVVHTGRTAGRAAGEVLEDIKRNILDCDLMRACIDTGTRLAIEVPAGICEFNCSPGILASFCRPPIGWCLDTAHAHAASVSWSEIARLIEKSPPAVIHANYPGSRFGSGLDLHGWRGQPTIMGTRRERFQRTDAETSRDIAGFDAVVRLAAAREIPLIVEGSSFVGWDVRQELALIRSIIARPSSLAYTSEGL